MVFYFWAIFFLKLQKTLQCPDKVNLPYDRAGTPRSGHPPSPAHRPGAAPTDPPCISKQKGTGTYCTQSCESGSAGICIHFPSVQYANPDIGGKIWEKKHRKMQKTDNCNFIFKNSSKFWPKPKFFTHSFCLFPHQKTLHMVPVPYPVIFYKLV